MKKNPQNTRKNHPKKKLKENAYNTRIKKALN